MSGKRFDLVCDSHLEWLMQCELFLPIRDKNTNRKISLKQCLDLLNELNDNSEFLEFENESLEDGATKYVELCHQSLKENEQLKSIVKEVVELLSGEVDVFSDKATEHDINAYIELKELDNKDAYYMATATKKAIKLLKEVVDD